MTFNGKFWEIHRKPLYLIHLYSMDGMSAGKKKDLPGLPGAKCAKNRRLHGRSQSELAVPIITAGKNMCRNG